MPEVPLTFRTPRQPGESTSGLERIRAVKAQQQSLRDANPTTYQSPTTNTNSKTHWGVDENGRVTLRVIDPMTMAQKLLVAGILGGTGVGMAGSLGAFGAGSAAGAGATSAAAPTAAGTGYGASWLAPGLAAETAAGAGGAAAAGGGGAMASLAKWLPLISQGASLGTGVYAGRQAEKARKEASGGMDFASMAPLIQALIQQQLTQSNENYTAQKKRAAMTEPMQQAMMRLAQSLMPR